MKIKLCAIILVAMYVQALGCNPAWGANWVFLRNSNGTDIYLDTDSIDKEIPNQVWGADFTVKHIYNSEQVHEDLHYREDLQYMSINCQTRYVEQIGIDILGANGEVARSWDVYNGDDFGPPVYIPPDSYGQQEIAIVCVPR